ncbi:adenylate/guanylate cyclase domain-containing protein [Microcoleus vaginatus ZQ-A3]|nr:adenylate/guanylate cyclase domain-containing protein [Microcoleus sp. FACHB-84]
MLTFIKVSGIRTGATSSEFSRPNQPDEQSIQPNYYKFLALTLKGKWIMNIELLKEKLEQLKKRPNCSKGTIDQIENWLTGSHILQRLRINPYYVAGDTVKNVKKITSEFLHGVKAGAFDLHWDIHCPHCNMITEEFKDLADTSEMSFCPMCEREFKIDLLDRVEVTFSLNKEIEDPQLRPVCAPPPVLQSKLQLVTPLYCTESETVSLEKGRYRYCCPLTLAKGILKVEGAETEEIQEIKLQQLAGPDFDKKELAVRPGKLKIELTNSEHNLSGLILHSDELPDELTVEQLPLRLSGVQLLHHPDYKRLFGDQVISERERVKIRAITIMFTDITGSTRMYETLGDTKAYNMVRDHFEIFFDSIEKFGGKVIKTIGDAVMASFISNEQAIMAATGAVACLREYNSNRQPQEWIQVRIGIHRGTALLVNLNNSSDYFGSTVNKAARLQNLSKSDEVSFSEAVYQDQAFLSALKAAGVSEIQKRVEDLKGIQGAQVAYTARINTESVIPLSATLAGEKS